MEDPPDLGLFRVVISSCRNGLRKRRSPMFSKPQRTTVSSSWHSPSVSRSLRSHEGLQLRGFWSGLDSVHEPGCRRQSRDVGPSCDEETLGLSLSVFSSIYGWEGLEVDSTCNRVLFTRRNVSVVLFLRLRPCLHRRQIHDCTCV